jgi:truncated hemoglobin YjbI
MNLPVRSQPLAGPRKPDEGLYDYQRRCWLAEFEDALRKIDDVPTRNALFALANLARVKV